MNNQTLLQDLTDLMIRIKEGVLGALPNLLGTVLLFTAGVVLASMLRAVIKRLLAKPDRLIPFHKVKPGRQPARIDPSVVRVIGAMVYWTVVFLFLTASTELLGLPVVTVWLSGIANYLPRILTAALIIVSGIVGANLLQDGITRTAKSLGITYVGTVTRLVRLTILLLSTLIAIDLVGLDVSLLVNMIYLVSGALLFGAALAFGLGSRSIVANILASYYLQKTYEVGQVIRMGSIEGRIVQITPTAMILQRENEQVLVPAEHFTAASSSMLQEGN